MGGSKIGCFSKVVEEFFELEGLPDSLGTVSDSDSSNDFLRFLPWVVGWWLQEAGPMSLREGHQAPGPQDSCSCLLPAEVEDLAGGGRVMAVRGPEERAAAVTLAAEPPPERHDGNVSMRQKGYPSDGRLQSVLEVIYFSLS